MKKLYKLIFSVSTLSAGLVSLTACNSVKNDQTGKDTKKPSTENKPADDQKPQDGGSNTTTPAAPSGDQKPQDGGSKTEDKPAQEDKKEVQKEFSIHIKKSGNTSLTLCLVSLNEAYELNGKTFSLKIKVNDTKTANKEVISKEEVITGTINEKQVHFTINLDAKTENYERTIEISELKVADQLIENEKINIEF
ncbi:hypothetical protein MCANPG14_02116 [Mycoplasmopsis canis PG 14]|uniref:hypothetical protein n=1 Tax=Mycoplasmopsis canis TaxID=29555 RepID=UPI00025AE993|nr:hypothetical protein [Mycoplasmopsis canis]EIE39831.1 hypothetical protein MCANPG14_02116 [Mycoplasmopsis canis PG 14]